MGLLGKAWFGLIVVWWGGVGWNERSLEENEVRYGGKGWGWELGKSGWGGLGWIGMIGGGGGEGISSYKQRESTELCVCGREVERFYD